MNRWDGIEEVVAIAATGSFAAAAKSLGVSTSHVSRAVARLETNIQSAVFVRTTRTVQPTDTGRALIERFRRILDEREEALESASSFGEPRGTLRITCSTALGERFVAPLVRAYATTHRDLDIFLHLSNHVVDLIAEGFDLAIRTGELADSRLIRAKIASRRLYLCASPAYLAAHGTPSTAEELSDHHCLVGSSTTWHFDREGRDLTLRPVGKWHCNSGTVIADAAIAGLGVCQLPEFYVKAFIDDGKLVPLLEHQHPPDEPVWAVYPHRRHLTPKVRLLVELLRRDLRKAMSGKLHA